MDFDGYGWGYGPFGHVVGAIVYGLFCLFMILVIVGILFLLVRFLLVATKAAQLYVTKNSAAKPVAPSAAATTTVPLTRPAPAAKPASAVPAAAAEPATKPRIPKTPPTPPTPAA